MKNRTLLLVFSILFICLTPQPSQACTTFCLDQDDQLVVGKNFDSYIGEALVIVNKRNVSKTALPNPEDDGQPASWISKYGSVTFNPFGREFSFSGINEAGLVVSAMGLQQTEFPEPDSRPYIRNMQWKQYQLDNFSTVEEVIASDSQLRISKEELLFGGHFLICDSMGNCAIIEFLAGERVYYTNETMPAKVLTNSTYAESIEYWKQHELPTPDLYLSVWRFITAADMLKDYDPETSGSAVNYAFIFWERSIKANHTTHNGALLMIYKIFASIFVLLRTNEFDILILAHLIFPVKQLLRFWTLMTIYREMSLTISSITPMKSIGI